jgi:hypothetical protein
MATTNSHLGHLPSHGDFTIGGFGEAHFKALSAADPDFYNPDSPALSVLLNHSVLYPLPDPDTLEDTPELQEELEVYHTLLLRLTPEEWEIWEAATAFHHPWQLSDLSAMGDLLGKFGGGWG